MAWPGAGDAAGGGRTAPPRPESPCTSRASSAGRSSGPGQPAVPGVEPAPMNSHTASAFTVVLASPTLPATEVMPTSSMSGCPWAKAIASASSIPGSQSRMILVDMSRFLVSRGAPDDGTERPDLPPRVSCERRGVQAAKRGAPMHPAPTPRVESSDPEIARLIEDEARRQYDKARLIPSENY